MRLRRGGGREDEPIRLRWDSDDSGPATVADDEITPPPPPPDLSGLRPSLMRGKEAQYGYIVAAELLLIAILNLAVTHGAGAPAHPQTGKSIAGVVAAAAMFPIVRTGKRMAASFSAIIAAFFVSLPQVPNSLRLLHIFALLVPLAYALLLTQRQRREALAQNRARGPRASNPGGRQARAAKAAKPGRGSPPRPASPSRVSGRYTPPKKGTTGGGKPK